MDIAQAMARLQPFIEDGYVLLTPNLRLARRIRAAWNNGRATAGDLAWESLPVQSLESWLLKQWELALAQGLVPPLVPLDPGQVLEQWQRTIAEDEQQSGSYHLLRPTAAAQMCSEARDTLLRWQLNPGEERMRQEFLLDGDSAMFLHWNRLFEQRLAAAGQCTQLDCIRQLLDCSDSIRPTKVALVEYDDMPPLYGTVVGALCDTPIELALGEQSARQFCHAFDDKRAELRAVACWVAALNREHPGAMIAVVLTDMSGDRAALEYLLRREFNSLGEDYASLPVNFSTGMPLDRTPVVRDGLAVLQLGLQRTTVPAVVALLQSRFLLLPDANTALAAKFVSRLYQEGQRELAVHELRLLASQVKLGEGDTRLQGLVLGKHLMAMAAMSELRQQALPSVWAERFSAILQCWGWPGEGPLDSLEYQQVDSWYRILEQLGAYDSICGSMAYEAALQLLGRCCNRQMSQPQTAESRVQVLGPLEAAGLAFDHLWVCGMQAGSWPAAARPNPFIPPALQRQWHMPHASAEREWMFAESLLAQYRRSTGTLHASYARQLDGVQASPSALLQGFSQMPIPEPAAVHPDWLHQFQQRSLEFLQDHQAPPLDRLQLAQVSGGSGLLEDQSHCPFRAFAKRRLQVEPLGTFGEGLSAAERGTLLHHALYVLWGEIGDHATLVGLQGGARTELIARAVQAALATVTGRRRSGLGRGYWELEGKHLARLLQDWLQVEQERTAFVVRQREQEVSLELAQLQIRLRVDRVDELPDGRRVIIDYKTGVSKVQDWLGDRPAKPQLLLYGMAEPQEIGALAFAQLRSRDCRYVGLGAVTVAPGVQTEIGKVVKGRMDADDWNSLNQRWSESLQRLAAEFVAGKARVDPLSTASCSWCGLQPLCRINAAGDALQEDSP